VRSAKKCRHCILGLLYSAYCTYFRVESRIWDATPAQEAKYVESWPNTTSAWAGWSRFDIPVDRYGGVHSLLICTIGILGSPTCHRASQQENTYSTIYQKADRASTLVILTPAPQLLGAVQCTLYTVHCVKFWDSSLNRQNTSSLKYNDELSLLI
jgi:hypothetical protein